MDKEFRGFIVEKVLNVEQTKSVIAKANLVEGDIPYVTRTVSDNGYMGTCGNIDKVNKGNCITIGAETGVAFYQPVDFVAGNKVYRLSADGLNEKHYLFLAGALNRLTKNYSYSNARIPEKIKKEIILLPIKVDENGNPIIDETHFYHEEGFIPDFDYMQKYIEELEQERIEELEQYLVATGLDDCELTDEDMKVLSLSKGSYCEEKNSEYSARVHKEMREFEICKLFDLQKGKRLTKTDQLPGRTPFIGSTEYNNGITGYIGQDAIFKGNAITISYNGSVGQVFFQENDFWASDDINVLYLKDHELTPEIFGYVATSLSKAGKKFSYSFKWNIERMKNTCFTLPIQTDASNNPIIDTERKYHPDGYIPDWDYMEKYIKAIEKIVIADVVQYKDNMISKTKEAVC
ncbi:MAG: restriction endonuclease subunit S [Bacteroidales bacterium]|nr:restriction endonuclease subunit S [Bacteroidales bacterium]